jgi:hypothetical protein
VSTEGTRTAWIPDYFEALHRPRHQQVRLHQWVFQEIEGRLGRRRRGRSASPSRTTTCSRPPSPCAPVASGERRRTMGHRGSDSSSSSPTSPHPPASGRAASRPRPKRGNVAGGGGADGGGRCHADVVDGEICRRACVCCKGIHV